jgi:hypothetical protein
MSDNVSVTASEGKTVSSVSGLIPPLANVAATAANVSHVTSIDLHCMKVFDIKRSSSFLFLQ